MRPNPLKFFREGFDSWLTARRLRAHGLLLGLTIWTFFIWTLATPNLRDRNGNLKGTDFLNLYTLGSVALAHRGADLYDANAQAALVAQRVPDAAGIQYLPLYPPQVSILLAPFARLSYDWALGLWWACAAIIYSLCCYGVWRACPNLREYRGTVALLAAAYPAFFHLIAWGQTGALALACFTVAYFFLRERREFVAGLVLGCLIFKPQLGLAAAIVFVAIGAWRIVAGASLSAAAQIGCGILYYGWQPFREWLRTLSHIPAVAAAFEPRPYQTHCLRTFWAMMVPWSSVSFGLYLVSAAIVLGWTIVIWKRGSVLPLRYSSLLLATVLVSPHLTVYDLVILVPALLLLAEWLISHASEKPGIGSLLYLTYVLPLVGPYARWTHVQLSVIAMVALICAIWKTARVDVNSTTAGLCPAGQPRAAVPT